MTASEWIGVEAGSGYFTLEGARWFPSGWAAADISAMTTETIGQMAAAGCNLVRVWPDPAESGQPSPAFARVLRDCEAAGVFVVVSLVNPAELGDTFTEREPFLRSRPNPYSAFCEDPSDLVTMAEARGVARDKIDAHLDAAGDSRAIFAWEVANQPDAVYQASPAAVRSYVHDLASHIGAEEQRRFGRRRLVAASSLYAFPFDSGYYPGELDFVALHSYTAATYNPVDSLQAALDMSWLVRVNRQAVGSLPILDTEHGPITHLFRHEYPRPLAPMMTRWRANTTFAHLCSGGAGGPVLVPPALQRADGPMPRRPLPQILASELAAVDTGFRTVLQDPAFEAVKAAPATIGLPRGAVGAAVAGNAATIAWVAADTRALERRELVARGLDGDQDVPLAMAYDAGHALLELAGRRVWNPEMRSLISRLLRQKLSDVADERMSLELRALAVAVEDEPMDFGLPTLAGATVDLPSPSGSTARIYDPTTGALVSTAHGASVVLPDLPSAVIAVS